MLLLLLWRLQWLLGRGRRALRTVGATAAAAFLLLLLLLLRRRLLLLLLLL